DRKREADEHDDRDDPHVPAHVTLAITVSQPARRIGTRTADKADNERKPCSDLAGAHCIGAHEEGGDPCHTSIAGKSGHGAAKSEMAEGALRPEKFPHFTEFRSYCGSLRRDPIGMAALRLFH